MRVSDYWQLLKENRFAIHPSRYPMTCLVGGCSVVNSTMGALQHLVYGKRIANAELIGPPIFIIGHWRSGTTMMHELIAMDDRFQFPSNFDAFIPNHLLISRYFLYPFVQLLMPGRRPMDNMAMGAGSPQEDDFALVSYGAPTPYRRIAFPNQPNRDHLDLNLETASAVTQLELRESMAWFLKTLTVQYKSRLVLKSPPHTGRLSQLAEWFPDAKFIHLSRHPYKLVPSTMRLWKLLDQLQGFQVPKYDDTWLKNYIFECKDLMYSAYFDQRQSLPDDRLAEVRFEDLVANPMEELGRVYDQLNLGGFEQALPKFENYFAQKKGHQKNKHEIDPSLQIDIDTNWHQYMTEFNYLPEASSPTSDSLSNPVRELGESTSKGSLDAANPIKPDPAVADVSD